MTDDDRTVDDQNDDLADLEAWDEEDEALVLPYRGKEYRIPPVSAKVGLRIERIISAAERAEHGASKPDDKEQVLSDAEELDLYPDVLGPVYDELLEDGVPFVRLKLAATATMLWTVHTEEIALDYWAAGGKAPAPNREQRRAATTRTGAANSTKRRASGTGTSTRPKRSAQPRKGAA